MKRRAKGEGSLVKRSDGRFQGSYVGSDGKRHYVYARTRKEASDKLTLMLKEMELGVFVAGPGQSVRQFLEAWLKDARARLRPRTVERYESLIRLHVIPTLGDVTLRKLTPQHLATLYATLLEKQAPASVAQLHAVLFGAFRLAMRWGLIGRNPAEAVQAPKVQRREMAVLTAEQAQTLMRADDPLSCLYVLAIATGMRQGELLALRWRDVDLDEGVIRVNRNLVRVKGAWLLADVKRATSRRQIQVGRLATDALKAHRLRAAETLLKLGHRIDEGTLIFTDDKGDPVNGYHVTERMFKPLLRRLGLPAVRFHDLRHTAASLMLSAGVRPDIVSRRLGHSSPAITLSIYAHLLPGDEAEAVRRLDAALGGMG
jgi:integrase